MNRIFKKLLFLVVLFISIFCVSSVKAATEIEVTDISIKEKNSTITVVDPVLDSGNITSNIKFNQKDDYVTFELTLKNNSSNNKYKVTSITDNNTNTNLKLDYGYGNDYIEIGNTSKVTLTITYKNVLLNQDKISLDDLSITINFEGEDGTSTNTTINPGTGDNIIIYFGIVGISLIGLFICIRKGIDYSNIHLKTSY